MRVSSKRSVRCELSLLVEEVQVTQTALFDTAKAVGEKIFHTALHAAEPQKTRVFSAFLAFQPATRQPLRRKASKFLRDAVDAEPDADNITCLS